MLRRHSNCIDASIGLFDNFIRTSLTPTLKATVHACLNNPLQRQANPSHRTAALMRVNHVGEVCAQALYQGHALGTVNPQLKATFLQAAKEEQSHLQWTEQRLAELGGRTSLLNPLWYVGALAIGLLSTRGGEARSLGFMAETEKQVEAHLHSHLEKIPVEDTVSRAIIERMCADEVAHAQHAHALGATELPGPIKQFMRGCAKVMTTIAYSV